MMPNMDVLGSLVRDIHNVLVGLFYVGKAVTIGGNHRQGLSLDDEQGAIQGVARLLVGDGENGARDEGLKRDERNAGGCNRGKLWDLGIVGARHADDFRVGAAAANLHPVVLKQLDGDVAVWKEFDVVVELACGDGAGASLFDLDCSAGADGLVEIGCGDVEAVVLGLEKKIRQDWNGGFALDNALRRCEFPYQILAAYGNLHRCPLCGRLLNFGFTDRHIFTPGPNPG